MKKTLFSLLSATALLWSTSCSDEAIVSAGDGEAMVQFTVELDGGGVASRSGEGTSKISDGTKATKLYYEVYAYKQGVDAPVATTVQGVEDVENVNGVMTAKVSFPLVKGQKYDVVFWAQSQSAYVTDLTDTADLTTINMFKENETVYANDDSRDAFTAVYRIDNVAGAQSHKVTLKRPFAQVNFGTPWSDVVAAEAAGANIQGATSSIKVKGVATKYNALTGAAEGDLDVEYLYEMNALYDMGEDEGEDGEQNLVVGVEGNKSYYEYLSTAYVLVPTSSGSQVLADLEMNITTGLNDVVTISVPGAPIARNYRTNVLGNLLTNQTDFTVEIDAAFEKPDNNKELWDGKSVEEPAYNEASKTYYIKNAAQLAWVAAAVNETLPVQARSTPAGAPSFLGYTFELANDIYLNNEVWTPISMSSNLSGGKTFRGTFDGKGYTIYNLRCEEKEAAGLFGYVYAATIKNVTVANASINSNHFAGGIVAWVNNLKGNIQVPFVLENCHVKNSEIISTPIEINGEYDNGDKVGGLIGAAWISRAKEINDGTMVENCSVENTTVKAYRDLGGLFGLAEGVAINDCELNNVTVEQDLTNGYKTETPTTVGSIIGRNEGGNTVNGKPYIADGVVADEINDDVITTYKVLNANGWRWFAQAAKENTFEGVTVKLDSDIDLFCGYMDDGDPITTSPIGDKNVFKGTLDGQNHTIKNLYQNGWALGYEWGVYGSIGLFSNLENATVKNLTIDGMDALVEGGDISFIAGSATGNCVFENITIKNSSIGTYNNGCGGIIGWSGAGNYTFKDITLGSDVVLGGLWGSFDSSIGGVVGQAEPGATYNFENVTVNCRIDAYNDCTASYDYYNYRMCGMVIGRCQETTTIDGRNYPDLSKYNMTFNNVVVNYGDWMNYHYCRKRGERAARVEPGYAYGGIAADRDHSTDSVHCMEWIPFDQLIGGAQYAVKGLRKVEGITVNYPESYFREQGYKENGDTYMIYSGDGFKTIATTVLADASKNVTIELANDIDLAGIEWPAVATKAAFVLDGKGKSIKNLTTTAVEDHGFYSTAMFTSTRKAATIKNLVIENATVTGKGGDNSHDAVLVACNYAALNIEGVTVKNSTVSNCDRSSVIATYLYFTDAVVKNCVVEGCTVNSIGTAGALLGMNNSKNFEATGNKVKNTTISSSEGSNKAGILIGTWQSAGTLTNEYNVIENSKAINAGTETNNAIGRTV